MINKEDVRIELEHIDAYFEYSPMCTDNMKKYLKYHYLVDDEEDVIMLTETGEELIGRSFVEYDRETEYDLHDSETEQELLTEYGKYKD